MSALACRKKVCEAPGYTPSRHPYLQLQQAASFRHKDDDHTYNVVYAYQLEKGLGTAAEKGDLQVALLTNLTNDHHWNVTRHWEKKTAYPVASPLTRPCRWPLRLGRSWNCGA